MKKVLIFPFIILLSVSCNMNQKPMIAENNPFFTKFNTPFEVPAFDKIKPEHFMPAFEEAMKRQTVEIDAITENTEVPTFENTIAAKDRSGEFLSGVSAVFFNLTSANTNPEIQKIARDIAPRLTAHFDNINLNQKLFGRIKSVYERKASLGLNEEQNMLLEKTYREFVRGGAGLKETDKQNLREINKKLSSLSVKFGDNLLAETNDFKLVIDKEEDLAGLPGFVLNMGAEDAKTAGMEGKWIFTLNKPSLIPFLQYSDKRELREKIYKGYINLGNNENDRDNKTVASQIVMLRVQKAQLLGYKTWADYILDENMAKTPDKVIALLDKVWNAALPKAIAERDELQKMMKADGYNETLEAWDWWYYTEKLRKQKYDLDDELLKPYFELTHVRSGMFEVASRLYGLSFTERNDIPKPHADAEVFEVLDEDGSHQAVLIMDFFPRESKRAGAWMSNYRDQYVSETGYMTPIVTMVMNFSKPVGDVPSLLTFEEVSTMFHEFGHALHGILSDCTYRLISGTNVARDFVELPSQIMENWVIEPDVLGLIARHYKTGEDIPAELIEKIKASAKFNQGFATAEYTAAAYLDMFWHTIADTIQRNANQFEAESMTKIGLIPEIAVRYKTPYFAHIFSGEYSSGYYSYQWAEVLDADAFEVFKEKGLFDKATATGFRENILEKGGTEDPMKLYIQFRGAEPKSEPMLKRKGLM